MCHWCANLPAGRRTGAAFLVLVKEYHKGGKIKFTILALRNAHNGKLTLPGGGVEPRDGGCCIETARRETYEESGLRLDRFPILQCCYLGDTRSVLVFAKAPNDIKRSTIDRCTLAVQSTHREACYHEMIAHCELIDVHTGRLIPENGRIPMAEPDRSSLISDTIAFIRMHCMHLF